MCNRRKTTDEFILEAKKKYGDKYDYSKVNYINCKTKVSIICPEHGEFWQTPHLHLNGRGCPNCNKSRKLNLDEFILRAKNIYGEKYDYSSSEYINDTTKIKIFCNECKNYFYKSPGLHIRKHQGCTYCAEKHNVSETFLYEQIKFIYQDTIRQYRPIWLKMELGNRV